MENNLPLNCMYLVYSLILVVLVVDPYEAKTKPSHLHAWCLLYLPYLRTELVFQLAWSGILAGG